MGFDALQNATPLAEREPRPRAIPKATWLATSNIIAGVLRMTLAPRA